MGLDMFLEYRRHASETPQPVIHWRGRYDSPIHQWFATRTGAHHDDIRQPVTSLLISSLIAELEFGDYFTDGDNSLDEFTLTDSLARLQTVVSMARDSDEFFYRAN